MMVELFWKETGFGAWCSQCVVMRRHDAVKNYRALMRIVGIQIIHESMRGCEGGQTTLTNLFVHVLPSADPSFHSNKGNCCNVGNLPTFLKSRQLKGRRSHWPWKSCQVLVPFYVSHLGHLAERVEFESHASRPVISIIGHAHA